MRKLITKLYGVLFLLWFSPTLALALAPPKEATVIVADSRKYTGWEAWWANVYNESHIMFALITIIVIPVCGVTLGTLADLVMLTLGIDLRSRKLAEH